MESFVLDLQPVTLVQFCIEWYFKTSIRQEPVGNTIQKEEAQLLLEEQKGQEEEVGEEVEVEAEVGQKVISINKEIIIMMDKKNKKKKKTVKQRIKMIQKLIQSNKKDRRDIFIKIPTFPLWLQLFQSLVRNRMERENLQLGATSTLGGSWKVIAGDIRSKKKIHIRVSLLETGEE